MEHGSVALPGIIRSGSIGGPDTFNMGTMPSAQQQITTGQMHKGHMPPLVSGSTYTYKVWKKVKRKGEKKDTAPLLCSKLEPTEKHF